MYYYKGIVPIPPLGMVDDLFTISICGYKTNLMNIYINTKTAMKKLQFGTSKCVKMHVGRTCNQILCNDLFVDGWKVQVISDDETVTEQMYLGDIISAELLSCPGLAKQDKQKKLSPNSSYSDNSCEMFRVGTELRIRLKFRKKILEEKEPD